MDSTSELAWFRGELVRSLVRPRDFARSLARENFGLAGVLVALVAGTALSLTIDVLVLVAKGIAPLSVAYRFLGESILSGIRVDVSTAVVAFVLYLAARATRRIELSMDQAFNAVAFALTPLIVAPVAAAIALLDPGLLIVGGAVVAAIALRALAGLALNLRAILPLPAATVALILVLASGWLVLGDEVSRIRMTAYTLAPQLAAPIEAAPAQGRRYEFDGTTLTVPEEWAHSVRGIPGELAHFETATASLNVVRGFPEALATLDSFASQVAHSERLGLATERDDRSVTRINGVVVLDDRAEGTYQGRRVAVRQFTIVQRSSGIALQFRFFDLADATMAFGRAAEIAATWRVPSG